MPYYTKLGQIPKKRHVQFRRPDGALYSEEVFGTEGFVGPTSTLYHINPPTQVIGWKTLYGTKPEYIEISVDREGGVYWNAQPLADHVALVERLKAAAAQSPQPEIQVRGDVKARYETVGRVVHACQRAGIVKVGFVTEPPPNP
jgi:biopolymer transport protein ExbD